MTTKALFTAVLLLVASVLLGQTLLLRPAARLAPLWVLAPTVGLLLLQLLLDAAPGVARRLSALPRDSLFGASKRIDAWRRGGSEGASPAERRRRERRMAVWVTVLVVLVYLVGFFAAVPIFLLPYLRLEAHVDWRGSLALTAVLVCVLYLVFYVMAPGSFPEGIVSLNLLG